MSVVVGALVLWLAFRHKNRDDALAYLDKCTPGQPYDACATAAAPTFPTGALVRVWARLPFGVYTGPGSPPRTVTRWFFQYRMQFAPHVSCDAIAAIVRQDLGEPQHGTPPVWQAGPDAIDAVHGQDVYWVAADGEWACEPSGTMNWYSEPLPLRGPDDVPAGAAVDKYVRPVPHSAAVWRKLGTALIDMD